MEAPKTLRRPSNWQDFESLCKKLWGEIWNCPEIKKNGRSGQVQHGVDLYGIPQGERQYYGIQCKGKDEYTTKQFTEKEITEETEKAKKFQPSLKKFYFATTAVKDATIEQFVREKNIDQTAKGLFEVHLYSWEDIVDLIDENRRTHDWYIKGQNFKSLKGARLTFQDNSTELTATVPFRQKITEYKHQPIQTDSTLRSIGQLSQSVGRAHFRAALAGFAISRNPLFDNSVNHSYYEFYFRLQNTGIDPIEEFKLLLTFEGEFHHMYVVGKGNLLSSVRASYNVFLSKDCKSGQIVPGKKILVGEEIMGFDDIAIKPRHEQTHVTIRWKLISKDYKDDGQLSLTLIPEIKKESVTIFVDHPKDVRIVKGEIEDFITKPKEND